MNLKILRFLAEEMGKIIKDTESEFDEQLRKVFDTKGKPMGELEKCIPKNE